MKRKLASSAERLENARRHRDTLIVQASLDGMSRREVAEAVGLSAGRIQHIVDQGREDHNRAAAAS